MINHAWVSRYSALQVARAIAKGELEGAQRVAGHKDSAGHIWTTWITTPAALEAIIPVPVRRAQKYDYAMKCFYKGGVVAKAGYENSKGAQRVYKITFDTKAFAMLNHRNMIRF